MPSQSPALLLAVSIVLLPCCICAYSDNQGREMARLSSVAYCSTHRISTWKCKFCDSALESVSAFRDNRLDVQGFVAYKKSSDLIIVVFRGTPPTSVTNWVNNFRTQPASWKACKNCFVHSGFLRNYDALEPAIMRAIASLAHKHRNASISLTGHSMGGALALLTASALITSGRVVDSIVTFGLPRVGNSRFIEHLSNAKSFYRVVNSRDIAVHLPPAGAMYTHGGQEVFYEGRGFIVCNGVGDRRCSSKYSTLFSWRADHHLQYMGLAINRCAV